MIIHHQKINIIYFLFERLSNMLYHLSNGNFDVLKNNSLQCFFMTITLSARIIHMTGFIKHFIFYLINRLFIRQYNNVNNDNRKNTKKYNIDTILNIINQNFRYTNGGSDIIYQNI